MTPGSGTLVKPLGAFPIFFRERSPPRPFAPVEEPPRDRRRTNRGHDAHGNGGFVVPAAAYVGRAAVGHREYFFIQPAF
eukprot:CAMPEP_0113313328 /NCGR_PEP_ID=MMETSP0010_2-20120614/9798_1 /TAXON_ID=216773 ORGANISM="Corethron hystrix, Strain 308" /NCGR_SAMPLE_ID=MMETSP0010_2 /ASSEMBLY_ACC=CAM_ASM_000155 /LENGTH=78 /DNA_ID=CAMNT_0000169323 /DNA_START=475 /DNA_END=711 /DNA_ORIENTATION=- /assembly_acc=CAM_ASM_000155